jgi:uncharacterized protein YeaO (DUF488 family)
MTIHVQAKRIYDPPEPSDGYRVLVDHIWPRGVSKEHYRPVGCSRGQSRVVMP